jgi:hypothetical protein
MGVVMYLMSPVPLAALPEGRFSVGIGERTYESQEFSGRKLKYTILYPSDEKTGGGQYVDSNAILSSMMDKYKMPRWLVTGTRYLRTNSTPHVAISEKADAYPIVVYLPGQTGFRQMNKALNEYLVSQGFIVVTVDSPLISTRIEYSDGSYSEGLNKAEIDPLIQPSIDPSLPAPTWDGTVWEEGIATWHKMYPLLLMRLNA